MSALITCCNEALRQIGAATIASLTENSPEANAANGLASPLLEEVAQWVPWPFKVKRAALAVVTNDRDAEWLHAYAKPSDMAWPITIRQIEDAATNLPAYGPFTLPLQDMEPGRYVIEGAKVYSNIPDATLVYTDANLIAGDMPPLLRRAFVLELAARLALPLKKDAKMGAALAQQAEVARARAIAAEENKTPRQATRYISEAEYARWGV